MTKKPIYQDPNALEESKKYDNPVPSREFILAYIKGQDAPVSVRELLETWDLDTDEEAIGVKRRLRAMVRDGQLMRDENRKYLLAVERPLISGVIQANARGYGFVVTAKGDDDLYLSRYEMKKVWHGDYVLARCIGFDGKGRPEGQICEITSKLNRRLVGVLHCGEKNYVQPNNERLAHRVEVAKEQLNGAQDGQVVLVELLIHPSQGTQVTGQVIKVIAANPADLPIYNAISEYDIPHEWSESLLAYTQQRVEAKEVLPAEIQDYTNLPFVTIDGEDAQDFDDAVYCKATAKGWQLMVAIAHVSHYVRAGDDIDKEAQLRGNSVYFPNWVIHMLPEVLSCGLCSLQPDVDRLAVVCQLFFDHTGALEKFEFTQGKIRSRARLTYTEVTAAIADNQISENITPRFSEIKTLHALYKALQQKRIERGALELDLADSQVIFDENGQVDKIESYQRGVAHVMIEECMLSANVAAAQFLLERGYPSLYRNHAKPNLDKVNQLVAHLASRGIQLKGDFNEFDHQKLSQLVTAIRSEPDAQRLQVLVLQSMSLAEYACECEGHFGLAYEAYTHFTSPIRRYPDLLVHRALCHAMTHKNTNTWMYSEEAMAKLGQHCSMTERRAESATRDVMGWHKTDYMSRHIGQTFSGVISQVLDFGLFIALDDIQIEGLVHISQLPQDYYVYDGKKICLRGRKRGQVFTLGMPVKIVVSAVNLAERKIDFELING